MCIIMVIPYGEKIPSLDVFKICAKNNKDGFGFMYRRNNTIRIRKGYFNVEQLYNDVKNIKNSEICIHFRYATHGTISAGNCHPFPLTNNVDTLRRTKLTCDIGIAHNGVISGMEKDIQLSDTMVFIKNLSVDNPKEISTHIKDIDGKFLIMSKYKTYLIGNFLYDDGIYYSNDGYKKVESYFATSYLCGKPDPYLEGLEMCEYCKHQYVEKDVVNKIIIDPCISCDGNKNFELSEMKEDIERYNFDKEYFYDDEIDLKSSMKYGVVP
jgi:hypothetical protein